MIIKIFGVPYVLIGDMKEESLKLVLDTIFIAAERYDIFGETDEWNRRVELVSLINDVISNEACKIEELELDNVIYEFEE